MKKVDLEKRIAKLAKERGATWVRQGGSKHEKWLLNGVVIMVPRHREIGEMLARKIMQDCERALEQ
ncbi:MAG TPA: type II toxin-antitoxin system HicA family toxin [Agromyces sp.]|nr:type II toxin-antitoxin system HicA family toxin [Agromyces sp.]